MTSSALLLALVLAAPAEAPPPAPSEARVVVFNREVAVFRAPFLGVTPDDRAARTVRVIRDLLDRHGPGKVTTSEVPQGQVVMVDGALAIILVPEDVDAISGQSLDDAAAAAARALTEVVESTRESREAKRLARAVMQSGVATALFLLFVWILHRIRLWFRPRLDAALERRLAAVKVGGSTILHSESVIAGTGFVVRAVGWAALALAAYEWLSSVLGQFPYTRPWGDHLSAFLIGATSRIGNGILRAIPNLFVAALVFLVAKFVVAATRPFFDRLESGEISLSWLDTDLARPTRRIVSVLVWIFALVMAYPYLPGSQSEAFKGVSFLVGLMVTVGASSVVGQAAAGLILMYSRTLRAGEYIRVAEYEGMVVELTAFATRLRMGSGEEITIPNALVLGTVIKNFSRAVAGSGFIVDTTVTIGYDTPWRQIEAMLIEAAGRTPGIAQQPPPRVFQVDLTDFYPMYRLIAHSDSAQTPPRGVILSRLHANIQDVFNEHGVQIMSPHYENDPGDVKVVPKAKWYQAPAKPPA